MLRNKSTNVVDELMGTCPLYIGKEDMKNSGMIALTDKELKQNLKDGKPLCLWKKGSSVTGYRVEETQHADEVANEMSESRCVNTLTTDSNYSEISTYNTNEDLNTVEW